MGFLIRILLKFATKILKKLFLKNRSKILSKLGLGGLSSLNNFLFKKTIDKTKKIMFFGDNDKNPLFFKIIKSYEVYKDDINKLYKDLANEINKKHKITNKIDSLIKNIQKKEESIKKWINRFEKEYKRYLKKAEKSGRGMSKKEMNAFEKFFNEDLNSEPQKRNFQKTVDEDIKIIFKSSWIKFAIFLPYNKNSKTGIFGIQIKKKFKSQRNPSRFYQWVRVNRKIIDLLGDKPRGKTFWDKWYYENRTNQYHLTSQSIYWKPKTKTKL